MAILKITYTEEVDVILTNKDGSPFMQSDLEEALQRAPEMVEDAAYYCLKIADCAKNHEVASQLSAIDIKYRRGMVHNTRDYKLIED
jgi:hypothetical protein